MIRKPFIIALLALGGFVAGGVPEAAAQKTVGQWTLYPVYNNGVSAVTDAGDKVYYLSDQRLFSYDKDTQETYCYTTSNKLNDSEITGMFYNRDGGYMLLAYATGNIDLIYDNGKVVNLSDIKDAVMTQDKGINDVAFGNGRIFVATKFGLVVYDEKTHGVIESAVYPTADIRCLAVMKDYLVMFDYKTAVHYITPVTDRHNTFDKGAKLYANRSNKIYQLGDYILTDCSSTGKLLLVGINWDRLTRLSLENLEVVPTQNVEILPDGRAMCVTATEIVYIGTDGAIQSRQTLPDELKGNCISFSKSQNDLWAGGQNGVGNYRLGEDGGLTVLMDRARPEGTSTVKQVAFLRKSADGSRIYLSNLGNTAFKSIGGAGDGVDVPQATDYIENGRIHDASITVASADKAVTKSYQRRDNSTKMYGGPERLVVDPDNPRRYYIANYLEGVYVVEDNKEIAKFDRRNMPMYCFWSAADGVGAITSDVLFDPEGNLWVGGWQLEGNGRYAPYCVLPKAKLKGDLSKITVDDWVMAKSKGIDEGNKDMGSFFTSKGIMFAFDRMQNEDALLKITDTRGTYTNTADDIYARVNTYTDQDGKTFSPGLWICGLEDARGRVWMGTRDGIVEFPNPAAAVDPTTRITRLKVPRNDGTIYADYLLESEQINDMDTDAADRKWIATENSGVYLVSQAGDQILEHFTAENSDLPSNSVYSVLCDPKSNIVYFGLATGLVSYNSTSSPAASDYSEVYAYPNPVRPEYSGWITISGLMDNSLVKIADAQGNVIAQMRSDGGMAVWDGCNGAGERVRTGVYYVYASQNANGSSSGAVTKILVVN